MLGPAAESFVAPRATTGDETLFAAPAQASVFSASRVVTALLVAAPILALGVLLPVLGGHFLTPGDFVIGAALYVWTGFGISIGYHRLLTHRSFRANRTLKILCAVAGSMALEGSVISWVAIHRRHHVFGDRPGDPHSPHRFGTGPMQTLKGFCWAQVGWLFASDGTDCRRYAPDLFRDPDLVVIDRLFPLFAVGSLAVPFALGWALTGTLAGALGALLWAGLLRMALLHHVTWSINSVCHLWGSTPFATTDDSTNVGALALLSFGESWHNFHHAAPSSARHGVLAHQWDLSAWLIALLERRGWATKVRWPNPAQIVALLKPGPEEAPLALRGAGADGDLLTERP